MMQDTSIVCWAKAIIIALNMAKPISRLRPGRFRQIVRLFRIGSRTGSSCGELCMQASSCDAIKQLRTSFTMQGLQLRDLWLAMEKIW
mmetsp:Transcript_25597/g.72464  ORF Transcript_25597/g.72464 Transcript_25597/m.72464 type:complete len:88 (-) Transcript_25597:371-634(-)